MPEYVGEPLAPGGEVEFFLYPASTSLFEPKTGKSYGGGETFSIQGRYQVQLAHFVPNQLANLWAGNSVERTVISEPVEIMFVEGTKVDQEILSVLWREGGGSWLSEGDDHRTQREDEQLLRDTAKRFPRERMSKYIYFALARSLSTASTFNREVELGRTREAVGYLELLRNEHPNFRRAEVSQLLGFGYAYLGGADKARKIFDAAMLEHPGLSTHYEFMWTRLASLYRESGVVRDWLHARARGESFVEPEAGIPKGK